MTCHIALCVLVSSWLTIHGYTPSQRDAVLKYINRESSFEFNIISRTGVCGLQWAGERRRAILTIGKGRCPDWRTQVDFADYEMHKYFCGFFNAKNPYYHIRQHFGHGAQERCK